MRDGLLRKVGALNMIFILRRVPKYTLIINFSFLKNCNEFSEHHRKYCSVALIGVVTLKDFIHIVTS